MWILALLGLKNLTIHIVSNQFSSPSPASDKHIYLNTGKKDSSTSDF